MQRYTFSFISHAIYPYFPLFFNYLTHFSSLLPFQSNKIYIANDTFPSFFVLFHLFCHLTSSTYPPSCHPSLDPLLSFCLLSPFKRQQKGRRSFQSQRKGDSEKRGTKNEGTKDEVTMDKGTKDERTKRDKTGEKALYREQKGGSGAPKCKIFDKKDKKVGKKFGIIRY